MTMLILGWGVDQWSPGEGVHEDFARITCDNVDLQGSIDGHLGQDPQRLCKDYMWQC